MNHFLDDLFVLRRAQKLSDERHCFREGKKRQVKDPRIILPCLGTCLRLPSEQRQLCRTSGQNRVMVSPSVVPSQLKNGQVVRVV